LFSDNETARDLLGFEDQVEDLCDIVMDSDLLPVTVGVLGDWGSGKSSLLRMAADILDARGAVVVFFSPWRTESYDDAKSALLDDVMECVTAAIPVEETPKRKELLHKLAALRRRVRWLRAAGLAAKHLVTLSSPSLDELDGLLRPDSTDEDNTPSTARLARDFYREFSDVVQSIDRPVVVLVDDLDRCAPEQVLDVLHAIRLFLAVPGTAFVLATDERVVRDAVRARYADAIANGETDLPQEYLEKIIQIPLRIPPMGSAEIEAYLNLLLAERHLTGEQMKVLQEKAAEIRRAGTPGVTINIGIARDALGGSLPAAAEAEFELIGRIGSLVASGLKGNPRQVKRFLNGLELRRRAAARRKLDSLDQAVLAKLLVLEYVDARRFRQLFEWQLEADGRPQHIADLEASVRRSPRDLKGATKTAPGPDAARWLDSTWIVAWLSSDPSLADVDLQPYFAIARDALPGAAVSARRLPEHLQALLSKLCQSSAPQRGTAVDTALKLDPLEVGQLIEAGIERLPTERESASLTLALADLTVHHPKFASSLLDAIGALPFSAVQTGLPLQLSNKLNDVAPAEVGSLLLRWEEQASNSRLSAAALKARTLPKREV